MFGDLFFAEGKPTTDIAAGRGLGDQLLVGVPVDLQAVFGTAELGDVERQFF